MEYRALFCVALVLIAAVVGQTRAIILETKKLENLGDNTVITLKDPSEGEKSALTLSYDLSYKDIMSLDNVNYEKTVTLSAPVGYGLFVAFKKIDFRSNSVDTLKLSEPGTGNQKTYQNINDKNSNEQFYAPSGKIQVSFKTVNGDAFKAMDYEGFDFTCTVQGNVNKPETCKSDFFKCTNGRCISQALTCHDFPYKYQHCGDESDHSEDACSIINKFSRDISEITISPEAKDIFKKTTTAVGTIVGIVFGVIIALIVLGGLIAFFIIRRASQRSRTQGHVR